MLTRLTLHRLLHALLCLLSAAPCLFAADSAARDFRVPAGDAARTLREFARQSGEQIIYLEDNVRGQQTRSVRGQLPSYSALQQMLADTQLAAHRDPATGALTVVPRPTPRTPAQTPPAPASATPPASRSPLDDIVRMTEFTVSSTAVDRYRAADAISAIRIRTGLLNTPGSISVMTRDVIDDIVPTRLYDVTRYIAGVEEGRGIQFADRQIIRGFESNGRTVDNFFQTGADNFNEALIDRIEVSKGPNAILAPAGVPGGSINVITKSPRFTRRHSLTAVVGLFDAQKVTLDLTGPVSGTDQLAYRLVAAAQDTRRYAANDARLRGKVIAPMLTWRISDRSQLTLKAIGADNWIFREPGLILDSSVDYDSEPILAPGFSYRSRNGIQPWSHVGTRTWDGFALFTSNLDEHLSVRLAANARHYFENSTQEFFSTPSLGNRYEPATGVLTPDYIWERDPATGGYVARHSPFIDPRAIPVRGDTQDTTQRVFNFQADFAALYRFGGVGSQTIAGGGATHHKQSGLGRNGTLPPIDLTQPSHYAYPVWSDALSLDVRNRQRTWQAYVNQRFTLLADRLQLTAGAFHYDVYMHNRNGIPGPAPLVSILDSSRSLWLASILVQPRPEWSLYYTRSNNSTPVTANDLPLWRDGEQDEVGFKAEFLERRLALSLAWFQIRQTNVSVPNPEHQTDPSAPEQLISNLADHGFEFELTGGLTENLSVLAAYTELRLRDSLGRRVRAVADRNAALLVNYRPAFPSGRRLSLFLGVTYAGERPGDATAVNFTPLGVATKQSFRIPSYYIANVGAAYKWGRTLLRLNVDNVFDEKNHLRLAGGRVSGTGLTAASGINLKLSTTVEF